MKKIAVFLDRDGTINEDVGYPNSFDKIKIFPESFQAIKLINNAGFLSIVVSNQAGVAMGIIKEEDLIEIHKKMGEIFLNNRVRIDAFYYCPFHPDYPYTKDGKKDLECRKPNTGMALQAQKDFGIDLKESFMVGDKVEDILFGKNIGAKCILVLTGYGMESLNRLKESGIEPDFVAENVLDGVKWILNNFNKKNRRKR
ncbi:MAG: HAD family hydrolase [Acidobacteriota bacterium]